MSYASSTYVACQTAQARLMDVWQQMSAAGGDENMPFAEWVSSQTAQVQQIILPGNSKTRMVQLTYFPRITEDEVNENATTPVCTSNDKYGNFSTTYEAPDEFLEINRVIDADDLTNFCEDNGGTFILTLNAMLDALERKIATQWADEAVALAGGWGALGMANSLFQSGTAVGQINGSSEYVWQTRVGGSSITPAPMNPEAWANLRHALGLIGNNTPALFGGLEALRYFQASAVGCCTDNGLDLAAALRAYGYNYSYDKRLETALSSTTKLMAFAPASIIPLWYVKGRWKDGVPEAFTNGAAFSQVVISTRRFGIPVDLTINQPCGTEVNMSVSVATKLIATPTDQFVTNDPYFTKNGINKITITNP